MEPGDAPTTAVRDPDRIDKAFRKPQTGISEFTMRRQRIVQNGKGRLDDVPRHVELRSLYVVGHTRNDAVTVRTQIARLSVFVPWEETKRKIR